MDYDAQPESIFDHYQQGGVEEEEEEEEEYEEGNQGEHEYYSELRRRNSGGGGGGGIGGDEVIGGGQMDSLDDSTIAAANDSKQSVDDSSAGKLFVGGIAWETSTDKFSRYFGKFGEVADSVIMMDKQSGRPRGFGFVTFVDPEVANKVLEEEHVIDGRTVEVKRTVPRDENHGIGRGVSRTKKIFVGGIPVSLTEDDLRVYFSAYGDIVEHQIMLDHKSGRSRGFGFVTFDSEDSVEKIFSDGQMHELGGKRVEIKRAEPKRPGIDHPSDNGMRRAPRGGGVEGGSSKPYGGYGGDRFGGGYVGKMGRGYGGGGPGGAYAGAYAGYGGYGNYGGGFGGGGAGMYGYGGYGYGFGFGGPMYGGGGGGYGAGSYGPGGYGGVNGYGMDRGGYGRGYDGKSYGGGGGGGGGDGGGAGYGGGYSGNAGASNGRFHPYRR